jgi:hypothetical protein
VAQALGELDGSRTEPTAITAPIATSPATGSAAEGDTTQVLPRSPAGLDPTVPRALERQPPSKVLPRVQRGLLLVGLLLLVTVGFAVAPYVCLAVLTVVTLVLHTVSRSTEAARHRQEWRGGARWYDGILTALAAPWHLMAGAVGTLLLLAWSAAWASVVGLAALLVSGAAVPTLLLAGAVLTCCLGWGPGSRRVRWSVRSVAWAVTQRAWTGWAGVGVLAVTAVACWLVLAGSGVIWEPLPGPPWRPGTLLGRLLAWV